MKQKLKVLTAVIMGVIVSILLWYGIYFYFNPVEEYMNFTAQGVLIYDTVPADYKNVDVEVNAKTYHYLLENEPDSIQAVSYTHLYDWVVKECEFENPPRQIEFAKLYLTNVVTGKRYIKKLVMDGIVDGWDDPRPVSYTHLGITAYKRRPLI